MRSLRTAMKSSPHSPQLEKACVQQQRPNAARKKKMELVLLRALVKIEPGGHWGSDISHKHILAWLESDLLIWCSFLEPLPEIHACRLTNHFIDRITHKGQGSILFFLTLLKYSWFTMLCLISAVQQSDSDIFIYIYILFHILSHYGLSRILDIVPKAPFWL